MANSPHALISGGSSGLGLALAQRPAARGHALTLLARDAARLADAQAMLAGTGATVRVASVDVRDEAAVNAAVSDAVAELGPPDLLVASAGIVIPGIFKDLPAAAFRETMAVNYDGTVHLVRAALPAMLARRAGRIVLVSSGAGLIGLYGYTPYAPTKFAVRAISEGLRKETTGKVRVCMICPGVTESELAESLTVPEIRDVARGMYARAMPAQAIADAIAYALTQPDSVAVNEIIVRPLAAQDF